MKYYNDLNNCIEIDDFGGISNTSIIREKKKMVLDEEMLKELIEIMKNTIKKHKK
jgi:hypothetical protein